MSASLIHLLAVVSVFRCIKGSLHPAAQMKLTYPAVRYDLLIFVFITCNKNQEISSTWILANNIMVVVRAQ